MSNLRSICRPQAVYFSITCCCRDLLGKSAVRVSIRSPNSAPQWMKPSVLQSSLYSTSRRIETWDYRLNQQRKTVTTSAYNWNDSKSPYETLELERDADEEQIKVAYRRLAKFYHPDVYNGRGTLEKGETAEARFIKIQAAYELLIDEDERRKYDIDNRVNPMKASEAWVEWLMKKRKAFDQRGDMAIAAWAEQQQLELNLKVRRLARSKRKHVILLDGSLAGLVIHFLAVNYYLHLMYALTALEHLHQIFPHGLGRLIFPQLSVFLSLPQSWIIAKRGNYQLAYSTNPLALHY
ncbi:PREDICTED: uncharacterized protein LOC109216703 isoform X3 [Nicotiana attenuata]|uniref:uncharacterized protein LOC109216703 isoform X3 n=1 Tax=Nicotiana attenuata TaxID=49451 RepID=UPI0009050158|nr:PREDICTED: uncharacterized protein LOC109216703 isoform X3 [Nicotiana attenuata]